MPDMTNVKQQIGDLYKTLDQLQPVVDLVHHNFTMNIPGAGSVSLPADRVVALKTQYVQLQSRLKALADAVPTLQQLGLA